MIATVLSQPEAGPCPIAQSGLADQSDPARNSHPPRVSSKKLSSSRLSYTHPRLSTSSDTRQHPFFLHSGPIRHRLPAGRRESVSIPDGAREDPDMRN